MFVAHHDPSTRTEAFDQAFSVWARFASDCVVVDAVQIEPVSVGKIPVTRQKLGNSSI
jgi:hypothetical protein